MYIYAPFSPRGTAAVRVDIPGIVSLFQLPRMQTSKLLLWWSNDPQNAIEDGTIYTSACAFSSWLLLLPDKLCDTVP